MACAATLAGCASDDDAPATPPAQQTRIERNADTGLVHVTAPTQAALGAGLGYAYAGDRFCTVAEHLVTLRGERSRHFGPEAQVALEVTTRFVPNLQSDLFHRFYMPVEAARAMLDGNDAESRSALEGWVAGMNRWRTEQLERAGGAAALCGGASWAAREITRDDVALIMFDLAVLASGSAFVPSIVGAQPPAPPASSAPAGATPQAQPSAGDARVLAATDAKIAAELRRLDATAVAAAAPTASNAWAFGRDRVEGGGAILFGNPHFPFTGAARFYQVRLTVPGQMDVAGAAISGLPVVSIGYNSRVSWTHTVSAARRFTLHELALVPGNPTAYLVDGQQRAMTPTDVTVDVRQPDGSIGTVTRRFWRSEFGPMFVLPAAGLAWGTQRAYAFGDVAPTNTRMLRVWRRMAGAGSVRELRDVLAQELALPWVNTIAADTTGEVLYADLTTVPNVEAADFTRCAPSPQAAALLRAAHLPVLDGSRAACRWQVDASTPTPGLMPAARLPVLIRTDFVQNSNDSYWLTNPAHSWEALSPMLGLPGTPQRPRTRAGLALIEARAAGTDGLPGTRFTPATVLARWSASEAFMAQVVVDDLVALCTATPAVTLASGARVDLAPACAALSAWDRRALPDSRGAHLFREFWRTASQIPGVHAVAFSPSDPIRTPRGLNVADARVREALLGQLGAVVARFAANGIAVDAPLGTLQAITRAGVRVAIPGCDEHEGCLNKIQSRPYAQGAALDPYLGTSWVQLVELNGAGVAAQGVLTYGQSDGAGTAADLEQLRLFARGALAPLPALTENMR